MERKDEENYRLKQELLMLKVIKTDMGDQFSDRDINEKEEDPYYNSDDEYYDDNEGYYYWNIEHDAYK